MGTIELRLRTKLPVRLGQREVLVQQLGRPMFAIMIDWTAGVSLESFCVNGAELLGPMPRFLRRKVFEFAYFMPDQSIVVAAIEGVSAVAQIHEVLVTGQEERDDQSAHARLRKLIEADPEQAMLVLGMNDPDVQRAMGERSTVKALPPKRRKRRGL